MDKKRIVRVFFTKLSLNLSWRMAHPTFKQKIHHQPTSSSQSPDRQGPVNRHTSYRGPIEIQHRPDMAWNCLGKTATAVVRVL